MKQQIINAIDTPRELESLYRANPKEFTRVFPDALRSGLIQLFCKCGVSGCSFTHKRKRMTARLPTDGAPVTLG